MTTTKHSLHGASAFARIIACPGSWRKHKALVEAGVVQPTSEYAAEGHAAHWLAEQVLTGALPPPPAPANIPKTAPNGVPLRDNTELLLAVSVYLEEIARIRGACSEMAHWAVERTVTLDPILEGMIGEDTMAGLAEVALFGTCDFVLYCPLANRLYVRDYKHGAGVLVPIRDANGRPNIQTVYYALGALDWLDNEGFQLSRDMKIDLGIVQPRAGGEPVRTVELTYDELIAFTWDIAAAVRATLKPDAPLHPGDHCRFCPALLGCEAIAKRAQELAQATFEEMDLDDDDPGQRVAGSSNAARLRWTNEELAEVLNAAGWLRAWLGEVQAEASRRLERGDAVPGWKLADKRATRKWKDEDAARRVLITEPKFNNLHIDDLLTERQLKSPAQIEQVLRNAGLDRRLLAPLVAKESSGTTLVPANDPREDRSGRLDPKGQFEVLDLDEEAA